MAPEPIAFYQPLGFQWQRALVFGAKVPGALGAGEGEGGPHWG